MFFLQLADNPYQDDGHLIGRQRPFNTKLSSLQSVVERSIQLLKGCWRKLGPLESIDMELLVHIIMSSCVLHNFCLLHDDFDDNYFLDHHDGDSDGDGGDGHAGGHRDDLLAAETKQVWLMNIIC